MQSRFIFKRPGPFFSAFIAGCVTATTGFLAFQYACPTKVYSVTGVDSPKLPVIGDKPDGSSFGDFGPVFNKWGPLPDVVAQVGLPGAEPVKVFPGFLVLYDRRTRIPRWTLELITPDRIDSSDRTTVDRSQFLFFEDPSEPQAFQATNADYFNSGFDRGHMAAAGNHKFDADAMHKSFVLSNIAPQVGAGFNRGAWNDLEKYIRGMAHRSTNVIVVTGPLFLPAPSKRSPGKREVTYQVIGPNNVSVPTHFFKAVAVQQKAGGDWKTYAWVMPNQALPEKVRLNSFIVPLKDLERAAGLIIFPNLYKP